MKHLYTLISLFLLMSLFYGCLDDPEGEGGLINAGKPELTDLRIYAKTATTVSVRDTILRLNGSPLEEFGIRYYLKDSPDAVQEKKLESNLNQQKVLDFTIEDLEQGKNYQIYAFARNKEGETRTSVREFDTEIGTGVIETLVEEVINATTVLAGGEITAEGEGENTSWGVYLSFKADMSKIDTTVYFTNSIGEDGKFLEEITKLQPDSTYYIQAFVTNKFGSFSGADTLQFTLPDGKPKLGEIELKSDINSIEITFKIDEEGDAPITDHGIFWNKGSDLDLASANYEPAIEEEQIYKVTLNDLEAGTLYSMRIYIKNEYGFAFEDTTYYTIGDEARVRTYSIDKDIDMGRGTLKVRGEVENEGGAPVLISGFCWSATQQTPTIDNSDTIHVSSGIGIFDTTLVNLRGGTTYYIRAFAINEKAVGYGVTEPVNTGRIYESVDKNAPGYNPGTTAYLSMDNKGYLLGGDTGPSFTNAFWEFDQSINEDLGNILYNWTSNSDFIASRKGQAIAYLKSEESEDQIIAFGGLERNGATYTLKGDVYSYYVNNTWNLQRNESTTPGPLHSAIGVTVKDSIFFIGGNRTLINGGRDSLLTETWYYSNGMMERMTPLPEPQYSGIAVNLNGVVYAGLGLTNDLGTSFHPYLWSSADRLVSWEEETDFPGTDIVRSGVAYKELIYVLDNAGRIWSYNPQSKEWKEKTKLDHRNPDFMWVLSDEYIYVGFGDKTIVRYDPLWDNEL